MCWDCGVLITPLECRHNSLFNPRIIRPQIALNGVGCALSGFTVDGGHSSKLRRWRVQIMAGEANYRRTGIWQLPDFELITVQNIMNTDGDKMGRKVK